MKYIAITLMGLLLAGNVSAYDQRDGSNGVPFLPPDPSLKTTDSFYVPLTIDLGYQLPAIFGGPEPKTTPEFDWMNLTAHNEKLNSTTKNIVAINSYSLTEGQMRDVPLGEENYL